MINISHEMENTNLSFLSFSYDFHFKIGLKLAMKLEIVTVDILFYYKNLYHS